MAVVRFGGGCTHLDSTGGDSTLRLLGRAAVSLCKPVQPSFPSPGAGRPAADGFFWQSVGSQNQEHSTTSPNGCHARKRVLPTSIIYGDKGLELWARITHLPSYYQTRGEEALLAENCAELARWIPRDSVLIDLGCGDIRKLTPLLEELYRSQKPVLYCPLDLSRKSIERAIEQTEFSSRFPCISVTGLWGSFEDGVDWVNRFYGGDDRPRIFLSLGSMLGNDYFQDAVARLKWLRATGLRSQYDMVLLTMDGTKDRGKICESYDDAEGLFTAFIRQGFQYSNEVLGADTWYRHDDWRLLRELTTNPAMHRFVLQANRTVQCPPGLDVTFHPGDEIHCYEGFKYGPEEMAQQFEAAGLKVYACWKGPHDDICKLLI